MRMNLEGVKGGMGGEYDQKILYIYIYVSNSNRSIKY